MALLLKGVPVAAAITERAARFAAELREKGIIPRLAIVRLGENDGDISYERGAVKRCAQAGVEVSLYPLPADAAQPELLSLIERLNDDESVHGVLIMRPLPKHIDDSAVTRALSPKKDVDGITPGSMAAIYSGMGEGFAPCTAEACLELLRHYQIPMEGRRAVIIGRSLVIGKPAAMLLLRENMTVTVCHSKTKDLKRICSGGDVIIAAAGKPEMVTGEYLSKGQTVLDVGIHASASGGLCGDVLTAEAAEIAEAVTPVPGGIGAVTTSVLAMHTISAAGRDIK